MTGATHARYLRRIGVVALMLVGVPIGRHSGGGVRGPGLRPEPRGQRRSDESRAGGLESMCLQTGTLVFGPAGQGLEVRVDHQR